MNTDQYGRVAVTETELLESIYASPTLDLSQVYLDDSELVNQYNRNIELNADPLPKLRELDEIDLPIDQFDQTLQSNWFMPDSYKKLDIEDWLFHQCTEEIQVVRVLEEIELFKRRDMMMILRYLKYLVDVMRENGIVWGVGRGSSVASYCLFLIGVHKIDSIKFNLDIKEFLK